MIRPIPNELVERVREWLGSAGIDLFRFYKEQHGRVDPVFMEDGIPHPVHFREGMHIRNFMRNSGLCADWDDIDYDNTWRFVIEEAIKED